MNGSVTISTTQAANLLLLTCATLKGCINPHQHVVDQRTDAVATQALLLVEMLVLIDESGERGSLPRPLQDAVLAELAQDVMYHLRNHGTTAVAQHALSSLARLSIWQRLLQASGA